MIRRIRRVLWERARAVHPDLQPASYLMLAYLADHGALRGSGIAEALYIDKGAVSRQLHHLVELGLVDRTPDPADGRATLVSASADAVRRIKDVVEDRRRWLDERLGDWTDEELARLRRGPRSLQRRARRAAPDRTGSTHDLTRRAPAPHRDRRSSRRGAGGPPPVRPSQTAVSAGSRPSSGPLAISTSPAGRATGSVPQLSTTVTGPRRNTSTSAPRSSDLDVGRRRWWRSRAAHAQRRAVERQRRRRGRRSCASTVSAAHAAGCGIHGLVRAGTELEGRLAGRPTASAPGSRRGPPRRCGTTTGPAGARGRRRPARGRAPRPGRGTTSRAARASSSVAARARARPCAPPP